MQASAFSSLSLNSELVDNLKSLGFEAMTPIQEESLPAILSGKDLIGQAKTGSGKTAAFGLGVLNKLNVKFFRIQALILCPTRELADQVAQEMRRLARAQHNIKILTLCGGKPIGPQIGSLEHGAHIIVGTPGRIEDHLRKGTLILANVNTLVLDEADRMLEMGFQESLDAIIEHVPSRRQTLLFSATYPNEISSIAERIMHNPEMVKIESTHSAASIEQHVYRITSDEQRLLAVRLLLMQFTPESALVFCNTKRETEDVADLLASHGFSAKALHGDMEQRDRDQTLVQFSNKSLSVLVATDVAARGLDIEALDLVLNYQLARDPEVHVHRVGRTGRAGRSGIACTLFSDREAYKLERLEDVTSLPETEALPEKTLLNQTVPKAAMVTLQIEGGKKQKVRPGDILGALTGKGGVQGNTVGKINIFEQTAYVAVKREIANAALTKLQQGKLKGRTHRVRLVK
ncbi:MAG: ATP-dependent RNA helicase DbpA [Agarilytica sp.]